MHLDFHLPTSAALHHFDLSAAMPEHSSAVLASSLCTVVLLAFGLLNHVAARPSARGLQQYGCSGIDVTASPYNADASGNGDSSPAFNAAIASAGGEICVSCKAGLGREHPELIRAKARFIGQTVCVPPGTYMVTEDVSINNDGVILNAPAGANIIFRNSVQWFVRGSSNTIQNIHVDCQGTPFSGFVVLGSDNHISGSSVRVDLIIRCL